MNLFNSDAEIKGKLKEIILEQKVSDMENTLSDTIGLFSGLLTTVGIIVALLIFGLTFWSEVRLSKKMKAMDNVEGEIKENKLKVESSQEKTQEMYSEIKYIHDDFTRFKGKVDVLIDEVHNYRIRFEHMEEQIAILLNSQKFYRLCNEIEEKKNEVSEEEIINYFTDEKEGTPQEQFEYYQEFYLDAKKTVAKLVEIPNTLVDYMIGKEDDVYEVSKAILFEYMEASSFLDKLNKIKR